MSLTVKIATSLKAVPAEAWDACANPAVISTNGAGLAIGDRHNPFVSHAFLSALEESGCVSRRTGWGPAHVLAEDAGGRLVAAAPCYLKSHSLGEYVFDHGWADAYERAGGRYYPKLQVSVPFTPVTGPRLLAAGRRPCRAGGARVAGARAARADRTPRRSTSPICRRPDCQDLAGDGFLARSGQQFHWVNDGYASFDDFLAALASRKRKAIRRERREALSARRHDRTADRARHHRSALGRLLRLLHGHRLAQMGPALSQPAPSSRLSASAWPSASSSSSPSAPAARSPGPSTSSAADALYGRNWGCLEDHPFLHFELCYYQAIDFAIERGLARVEAGAQGEHKLARGYRPVTTWSAHDLADPGLKRAVADYVARERCAITEANEELESATPFRRG